jgi:lipopolysaccharide export system ATP-binding protein
VDRAYIIDRGRILREGPPRDIVASEDVRRSYLGADFRL